MPVPEPETVPAVRTVRSYKAVLDSIDADLKGGDQLPGERALALKHGVARASTLRLHMATNHFPVADIVPSLRVQLRDISAAVPACNGELADQALRNHIECFRAQTHPLQ